MKKPTTESDLEAYLDEALPADEMSLVEAALREDQSLVKALSSIHARRNSGVHTLGEVWRNHRLSCPARDQLGSYLLETLSGGEHDYVHFHVSMLGCRYCQANLDDLRQQQAESVTSVQDRRRKYFQSSAGYLRRR